MSRVRVRALYVLCVLLLAAPARAQFESGSVVGTVTDATGGVVSGAAVTLVSAATGVAITRSTGAEGEFEFVAIKPGLYVVSAEKPGFSVALVDNVQVQVGSRPRVDLTMTVGAVTDRVEVTAATP